MSLFGLWFHGLSDMRRGAIRDRSEAPIPLLAPLDNDSASTLCQMTGEDAETRTGVIVNAQTRCD